MQVSLTASAHAAGAAVALGAPADGSALADVPRGRVALGVLNGAHGDLLSERVAGLALADVTAPGRSRPARPT